MANKILVDIDQFFKKMVDAHTFEVRNKKLPAYVAVIVGGKEYHVPPNGDYGYIEGLIRVAAYVKEKQDIPEGVYVIPLDDAEPVVIDPTPPGDGWVTTGLYKQDYQDTGYTCGPSSAQMVFSAMGLSFDEARIAQLAGTTAAGTSHQQLYSAMKALVPSLLTAEHYLSDIGFNGMVAKLQANREIILHIRTGTLKTDYKGAAVWTNDYGHYVFVTAINLSKQLITIADPTKGLKTFTFSQISRAIAAVSGQKSVMLFYKP